VSDPQAETEYRRGGDRQKRTLRPSPDRTGGEATDDDGDLQKKKKKTNGRRNMHKEHV
jgi:hypothetical protein